MNTWRTFWLNIIDVMNKTTFFLSVLTDYIRKKGFPTFSY